MNRLLITLSHSALAASVAAGGVSVWLQAVANRAWEQGFYGASSGATTTLLLGGVALSAFALLHGASAWGYFVGARFGPWGLALATAGLVCAVPLPVALVAVLTTGIALLDHMVQRHRIAQARAADRPPGGPPEP